MSKCRCTKDLFEILQNTKYCVAFTKFMFLEFKTTEFCRSHFKLYVLVLILHFLSFRVTRSYVPLGSKRIPQLLVILCHKIDPEEVYVNIRKALNLVSAFALGYHRKLC